jgi:hypothetical protein
MRKLAVICAALALTTTALTATAQDDVAKNRFGFLAGVNASKLGGYVPIDVYPTLTKTETPRRSGMAIGGVFEHSLGSFGFLRIEPKYIQKGSKLTLTTAVGTASTTSSTELALDYLDVPIMLRSVYFQKRDWAIHPVIQVGVGPDFLLSAKLGGKDAKSSFKSVEWGITAGFGVTGKVGKAEWSADFRFVSSLSGVGESVTIRGTTYNDKAKNAGMGGALSFTFPLGK